MNVVRTRLYQKIHAHSPDGPHSALPFSARLARENRGSPQFARRAVEEYKKFMFLAVAPGHPVPLSPAVDQAWHLHLVPTRSYWEDVCGSGCCECGG